MHLAIVEIHKILGTPPPAAPKPPTAAPAAAAPTAPPNNPAAAPPAAAAPPYGAPVAPVGPYGAPPMAPGGYGYPPMHQHPMMPPHAQPYPAPVAQPPVGPQLTAAAVYVNISGSLPPNVSLLEKVRGPGKGTLPPSQSRAAAKATQPCTPLYAVPDPVHVHGRTCKTYVCEAELCACACVCWGVQVMRSWTTFSAPQAPQCSCEAQGQVRPRSRAHPYTSTCRALSPSRSRMPKREY